MMTPVIEHPEARIIVLRFTDGKEAKIRADKICEPDETDNTYRLKLEGHIVAKYSKESVEGWHLQSKPTSKPLAR